MKKHGVPKKFIKQEEKEAKGMNKGGMACGGKMKYADGGAVVKDKYDFSNSSRNVKPQPYEGVKQKIADKYDFSNSKRGASSKAYAKGGGIESKGKTSVKMVRMASGGMVGARADGIASRGKTKCKIC